VKKIKSLFCRNYDGDHLVRPEVVEGSEWVLAGEGVPTRKWDGTSCMVRDGALFKRYDRKLHRGGFQKKQAGETLTEGDFKSAPADWEACEAAPNLHTGHWPGWIPVSDKPEDCWHREALAYHKGYAVAMEQVTNSRCFALLRDGTYELIGPKVQNNAELWGFHERVPHGCDALPPFRLDDAIALFSSIRRFLSDTPMEGIVWHHPDGRMVKIKSKDFGIKWPPPRAAP